MGAAGRRGLELKDEKPDKAGGKSVGDGGTVLRDRVHDSGGGGRRIFSWGGWRITFCIPTGSICLGIIFGAVAGFVSMIRRALEASKDEEKQEKQRRGRLA
jgi:hypothetical protein